MKLSHLVSECFRTVKTSFCHRFFLFRKSKHVYLSINQSQRFYPEYLEKLSESICMNDVFLYLKNLIAVKAFLFD